MEVGVDLRTKDVHVLNLEPAKDLPIPEVGDQVVLSDEMESGARAFLVKKRTFIYSKERLVIVMRVESAEEVELPPG